MSDNSAPGTLPPLPSAEEQRIRSIFPLHLPSEVMARIEYLSTMNCIREARRVLHAQLLGRRHILRMVDHRFLVGVDYMHAWRMPGLIDGSTSSEAVEWDTDDDHDADGEEDPDNPGVLEELLHMEGWQDVGGNLE